MLDPHATSGILGEMPKTLAQVPTAHSHVPGALFPRSLTCPSLFRREAARRRTIAGLPGQA